MELTPSQKKTVRHQFDSFCKKILREEGRNYIKEMSRRSDKEVNLSGLSEEQLPQLNATDIYPSDFYHFEVQGYPVYVSDDRLAAALSTLTDEKRDILLLSFFFDLTDKEIADKLNMVQRTVQRRRASSLEEMKKRMEVMNDGKQSE